MANRQPFSINEYYHCYSRGVDKRRTFQSASDYKRFIQILYLANSVTPLHRSDFENKSHEEMFSIVRGEPLVAIGAYCLMPNHFHILLRETRENGIALFMQKVGIAYTMYFNIKHERTGNLFVKPFRSKHVADDAYLRYVAQYIHLNPIELFEPQWKQGKVESLELLKSRLAQYPYSSLEEYWGSPRSESVLIDPEIKLLIEAELPEISSIINDVGEYYQELKR